MPSSSPTPASSLDGSPRNAALDGLRGLMTIVVLLSHFFAEIDDGYPRLGLGWLAVDMFFILSGFLIGRLIIERKDTGNFLSVFVMRRICRTVPSYFISVLIIFLLLEFFGAQSWTQFERTFPLWSYLTFSQNMFMAFTGSVGVYWLAPTWTLALEEQLYVLLPLVFFLMARRYWLLTLTVITLAAVLLRALIFASTVSPSWGLVLLPTRGDVLIAGVIAAVLFKDKGAQLSRYNLALRSVPVALLFATVLITALDPSHYLFNVFGPFLVSAGFACLLLAIVTGAPEAKRFESRFLRFFGHISYCVYLTHLTVLALAHGLILDSKPTLGSAAGWFVTLVALVAATGVGWLLTTLIEAPLTAYGRSWKWSSHRPTPALNVEAQVPESAVR